MISIELEGWREVEQMFDKLGEVGAKYFQKALTETAIEGTTAMRTSCPVKTNRLRASIHFEVPNERVKTYSDRQGRSYNGKFDINLSGVSAAFGTNVEYAEAVNYGTAPHEIRPINARALRFMVGKTAVFAKSVQHPGTKGHHFFEAGEQRALAVLEDRLRINYEKAINEVLR
jgi:hypothetical protein